MGALVEQPIPTLFGGVSTQPAPVRQANQTETGVNAKFSVFTGGFEKRLPKSTQCTRSTGTQATSSFSSRPMENS
jgi:hypothetical protein